MTESLIERINQSTSTLGVTREELLAEILTCYRDRDVARIKSVYGAYCQFEVRNRGERSQKDTEALALENFGILTTLADYFVRTQPQIARELGIIPEKGVYNPVQVFYRTAIGHPLEDKPN